VGVSSLLTSLSPRMMIHKHTVHMDGFTVFMYNGVKNWCFDVVMRIGTLDVHILPICRLISLCAWVICLVRMCANFSLIYICVSLFLFRFQRFCGYIFCKPSRDLTRPLGGTKGFKGLVAYAKCNRDSYESELDS